MVRKLTYAAAGIVLAGVLSGCASLSGSAPPAAPSAAASSALAAPPPSPSPSGAMCTTRSCIASDAQQSMVGTTAEDGSVVTKAKCFRSTVRHNGGDTWTVSCDVTYTDQTVWAGLVTILPASGQVSWQPETQVQ